MRALLRKSLWLSAGGALACAPLVATALPFNLWGIDGRLDTVVSLGATFRMQDADPGLIGISNGGTSRSVNDDDGNLGFGKGDVVAAVAKATHDLEMTWGDFGVFARASYFYDQIAADASKRESRLNAAGLATRDRGKNDYELGERGRDRLESEVDLLDLFAYGRFDLGGRALAVRYGRQVVSWGESTFIQNGINSINPIDVARIRAPGAELKEALLPTPLLWTSFQIADGVSLEAVWMTGYEETRIDPRGSFFSTNDFVSDDGDKAIVSFGRRRDDNRTIDPANAPGSVMAWVPREASPGTEDSTRQFGVTLRYFAEALNDTEFGLYYLSYHSRTPLVSAIRGASTSPANVGSTTICSEDPAASGCRATYFAEFPSNIDLYGLSFNTDGPWGVALQGEYSYRPNQPLQISGTEVLLASLGVPTASLAPAPLAPGAYVQGYRDVEMHQVQMTGTKAFGPSLGAQQLAVVGEVGYNYFNLPDGILFNGPGAGLPSCTMAPQVLAAVSNGSCQQNVGGGFATSSSWGYRLVGRLDYENVVGPVSMSPRLVFAHDVNGVGPNFNQDTKAVTVGVAFNYLQAWQADIGYTTFFGGRDYSGTDPVPPGAVLDPGDPNATPPRAPTIAPGDSTQSASFSTSANPNRDRDFLAVSVSYAF
ncbi:MAG TPA: DUF1302 domain-containing protein [Fontimonas sp.]